MKFYFKHPYLDIKEKQLYYTKHKHQWECLHIDISKLIPDDKKDKIMLMKIMGSTFSEYKGDIYWFESNEIIIMHKNYDIVPELLFKTIKSLDIPDTSEIEFKKLELEYNIDEFITLSNNCIENHNKITKIEREKDKKAGKTKKISIDATTLLHNKSQRIYRREPAILVVEDDNFVLNLITTSIKQYADVIIAQDLHQAAIMYERIVPDLVFLDINLPDGSGLDLLKLADKYDTEHYIVMLTSNKDKETVLTCKKYNAKGFVTKPFKPEKLHEHINKYKNRKK